MPKRMPLPPHLLTSPFSIHEALASGVTPDRLRSRDLDHPFRGVRSRGVDLSLLENLCLAFATRMPHGMVFSHATAAMLWGVPLPLGVATGDLHVSVVAPDRTPRMKGVIGHTRRLPIEPSLLRGLAVASPAETWADLAETLDLHDLIAAGDYLVTGNPIRKRPSHASVDDLRAVTERRSGIPGSRARASALRRIEVGPLSRPESLTRLLLVDAGLPHPLINPSITDSRGVAVAMPDLAWPDYMVALEYEGDDHRSVKRFRDDIARVERVIDNDWLVVKASADDLYDRPRELVERVIRRLVSRGWVPGRIRLPENGIYAR